MSFKLLFMSTSKAKNKKNLGIKVGKVVFVCNILSRNVHNSKNVNRFDIIII